MMKFEFIEMVYEISPTHIVPTDEEYKKIEFVYTYHPAIADKGTIARLWCEFGNMIIEDMTPRAERVRNAEVNYERARKAYEAAREIYQELTRG